MTRTTNARLAGFMFLFYIATGIPEMIVYGKASAGAGTAARLASIAAHLPEMRWATVLTLLTVLNALVLGVALYAVTRDEDRDLALLALLCRVIEGATNAIPSIAKIGLLAIATSLSTATPAEVPALHAVGTTLLKIGGWTMPIGATLFAIGSAIYSYLFLRSRAIPVWLAWLGLVSSALLIVTLPLQGLRLLSGSIVWLIWIPVFVFEVTVGFWLLIKGVNSRALIHSAPAPAAVAS